MTLPPVSELTRFVLRRRMAGLRIEVAESGPTMLSVQ